MIIKWFLYVLIMGAFGEFKLKYTRSGSAKRDKSTAGAKNRLKGRVENYLAVHFIQD